MTLISTSAIISGKLWKNGVLPMKKAVTLDEIYNRRYRILFWIMSLLILLVGISSLYMGRFTKIHVSDIPKILLRYIFPNIEKTWTATDEQVIMHLRLPRVIGALVVGASLAISGASYQSLFSNPVASPDTLGVSAAASFGAVLAMVLDFDVLGTKVMAFLFGCMIVFGVFYISSKISKGRNLTVFLVLIGMIASALFQALLSILKYTADPVDELPKITYWLMGSFSHMKLSDLLFCLVFFLIGAVPLFLLRWRQNLLSLSESEARSMGENVNRLRLITVSCATLLTSSAVAMTGGISWVGLVIPHITRFIVGPDSRKVLPISAMIGALFLLVLDDIARASSVYELPMSVLTSLIGAPIFFAVILKTRRQMSDGN